MSVQDHVKHAVQRSALGGVGALFTIAGIGFLSASAFLVLQAEYGAQIACLVLGGAFTGLGLIAIAIARAKAPPPERPQSPLIPLAAAFLDGLNEGMATRRQAQADTSAGKAQI
ncbi:MAG: phage holin family protein [Pseudomonadota bacterium]